MRVVWPFLLAATAACGFSGNGSGGGDGGGTGAADASVDSVPGDAPETCDAWHPHHFNPCAIPAPLGPLEILTAGEHLYNTDNHTLDGTDLGASVAASAFTPSGGIVTRLISVDQFVIGANATLHVVGNKPLIVASWDDITIQGTIDAGSNITSNKIGAGADQAFCAAAMPGEIGRSTGGSGGGGGGGFRGGGGTGGTGDDPPGPTGGAGGGPLATPMVVRGGCQGARSGQAGPASGLQPPATPESASVPGHGGGGVQLTARDTITIVSGGRVLAGGAGGGGSPGGSACGGGGAGSGGYVGLEGTHIMVQGVLAANGGGGGASATFSNPAGGDPGDDGQPSAAAAAGGALTSCAVAGGVGAAGTNLDGATVTLTDSCGGGGAGGGAGYILVFGNDVNVSSATISPPHLLNPF